MIRLFCSLALLVSCTLFAQDTAYDKYKEGEKATNPVDRKAAFNEALRLYLQLEGESPSSELLYDIGNTYYQLNEYGYAILYYNKALKENPRFDAAENNLQIAQQKVGLAPSSPNFIENYILFFHTKLSHNEKAYSVLFLLFGAFLVFSLHLWMPQEYLKKLGTMMAAVAFVLFISIAWTDYFAEPRAVVLRSFALKRDAGEQFAAIDGLPVLAGSKVVVVSVTRDGNWLKVQTPSGQEGYISKENARII